jgi:hypothetical protein
MFVPTNCSGATVRPQDVRLVSQRESAEIVEAKAQGFRRASTENNEAYRLYLGDVLLGKRTEKGMKRSLEYISKRSKET